MTDVNFCLDKQIFVFTSAGKPIFSRLGDENDQVTTFGLLQAVASIVDDSGDSLRCVRAGRSRILYFFRRSLYFVCVSPARGSTEAESEAALVAQLEFLYRQIIFMLTHKVHDLLRSNPSKDLRELLGTDTFRLMRAACTDKLVPPPIAFRAVRACPIDLELRSEVLALLRACTRNSEAVAGFVFVGSQLLAYCGNDRITQFSVADEDIITLAHFLGNSPSLLSHEQNWVPVCLPSLNPGGYVQAYIAALTSAAFASPSSPKALPASASASSSSLPPLASQTPYLVLISSSAEGSVFSQMHDSRQLMCEAMYVKGFYDRIQSTLGQHKQALTGILDSVGAIQFFYKVNSSLGPGSNSSSQGGARGQQQQSRPQTLLLPSQCVWQSAYSPINEHFDGDIGANAAASDSDGSGTISDSVGNKIWVEFQNLAVRVRLGSASLDSSIRLHSHCPAPSAPALPAPSPSSASPAAGESAVALALPPASDHALAYSVLEDCGFVLVALATPVSEMFVAFPGTLSPTDACGQATVLGRALRQAAPYLFLSAETLAAAGGADVL